MPLLRQSVSAPSAPPMPTARAAALLRLLFTQIPGVMAQAPAQYAPPIATGQKGRAVEVAAKDTRSLGLGTSLLRTFSLP